MHLYYYPSSPCWVCPCLFANHYKLVKAAGLNTSAPKIFSQKIIYTLAIIYTPAFTCISVMVYIDPN